MKSELSKTDVNVNKSIPYEITQVCGRRYRGNKWVNISPLILISYFFLKPKLISVCLICPNLVSYPYSPHYIC